MKKALLVLVISFLVLGSTTFAQLKFGVKAGMNFATFGGDDADIPGVSLDSKTGFVIGGFMNYSLSDMFALQPELLYSMKGSEYSGPGGSVTNDINYIEIPVLVRLNIPIQQSTINPYIYAGPAVGFKMSAEQTLKITGQNETTDDIEDVNSIDFGLAFGAGLGFPIGAVNTLGFDFRYSLGLSSIDDSGADLEITNNVMSLTAFFGF